MDNNVEISGWLPASDELVAKYGVTTAAVFGFVWRRCRENNGQCTDSVPSIAKNLKLSRQTTLNKLQQLCRAGYLKDSTPTLSGEPHTYIDNGKIKFDEDELCHF